MKLVENSWFWNPWFIDLNKKFIKLNLKTITPQLSNHTSSFPSSWTSSPSVDPYPPRSFLLHSHPIQPGISYLPQAGIHNTVPDQPLQVVKHFLLEKIERNLSGNDPLRQPNQRSDVEIMVGCATTTQILVWLILPNWLFNRKKLSSLLIVFNHRYILHFFV